MAERKPSIIFGSGIIQNDFPGIEKIKFEPKVSNLSKKNIPDETQKQIKPAPPKEP